MDHSDMNEDRLVNTISTSLPTSLSILSNVPASSEEHANIRSNTRPALLRSRRAQTTPPSLVAPSSSMSGSDQPVNNSVVQQSSLPSQEPLSTNSTASGPTPNINCNAQGSNTAPAPSKPKNSIKELEAQCKAQDASHSIDISDFECSLCFRVFFQPVTTVCGHVFCKQCLLSSLKYSVQCPLCRHKLDNLSVQHKYAVNVVLMNMIEKYFPKEYKDRVDEDGQYEEQNAVVAVKQTDEEGLPVSITTWGCIIPPSLRTTCHVILSCGGF